MIFMEKNAFKLWVVFLSETKNDSSDYAMVGYKLENTLSENGSVSRGICQSEKDFLTDVVERTSIMHKDENIVFTEDGKTETITGNSVVSMNFWGFSPLFFKQLESDFIDFINEKSHELKAEFYIPTVANNLIESKDATIKVLTSDDRWFGVTYQEDKETTIKEVKKLVDSGYYPKKLWD